MVALAPLAASAAPPTSATMTLTEARKLSPQRLAERLLGATGASGDYAEAKIDGDGGIMIHRPGLNSIELYKRPVSAGFAGLCQVDGVHIEFGSSRYNTPGDPPHKVSNFWKITRFAMLKPTADRIDDADWNREGAECAKFSPITKGERPAFFYVGNTSYLSIDKPVFAYFAVRALAKTQKAAADIFSCRAANDDSICADVARGVAAIPIRKVRYFAIDRCRQDNHWCVTATWIRSCKGNETHEVELAIRTDATAIDPPADFRLLAVDVNAGTSVDD